MNVTSNERRKINTAAAAALAQKQREERHRLRKALSVLILTPHIREYLQANDPKALEQAENAFNGEPT